MSEEKCENKSTKSTNMKEVSNPSLPTLFSDGFLKKSFYARNETLFGFKCFTSKTRFILSSE